MLNGYVKVMTYLGFTPYSIYEFIINFFRITVQKPDPFNIAYFTKLLKQDMESLFSIYIHTVNSCFLSYNNKFLYA